MHAYSLELGTLLNASVRLKIETRQWEVRLNQTHLGDYDSPEDALQQVEEGVRDQALTFIEDWTIWTASRRIGIRMPKRWC